MARYWVGGSGTWLGGPGTSPNWSSSSGGAGGASNPNSSQDIIFDANSNDNPSNPGEPVVITLSGTGQGRSIVAAGFTGELIGDSNIQITGSNTGLQNSGKSLEWNVPAVPGVPGVGMTLNYTGRYTITGSTGSGSINFNGHVLNLNNVISFNWQPSTWTLLNPIFTTNSIQFNNGILNTNNYNITCERFDVGNAVTPKTLNLGSSIITCTIDSGAAWVNERPSASTLTGTYTIRLTGIVLGVSNSITFIGGTSTGGNGTYYNVEFIRGIGTGTVIIEGSNTFTTFKDTGLVAHDITFTDGTTQTFQNFNVVGASGLERTRFVSTVPVGGQTDLVKIGNGFVYCDYLDLGDDVTTASPLNTWYAGYNSIGSGPGWILGYPRGLLSLGVGG